MTNGLVLEWLLKTAYKGVWFLINCKTTRPKMHNEAIAVLMCVKILDTIQRPDWNLYSPLSHVTRQFKNGTPLGLDFECFRKFGVQFWDVYGTTVWLIRNNNNTHHAKRWMTKGGKKTQIYVTS